MKNTELITVPTFNFRQGETGENYEEAINVTYYSNCICLTQEDNQINILYEELENLFKEIKRHRPEAEHSLKNRK